MTASSADSAGWSDSYPAAPSEEEMAEQEAILAEEIAAGVFEPPPWDEIDRMVVDPDTGPPEGDDWWLGALATPARDAILDAREAAKDTKFDELFPTGIFDHDGQGPGGPGFSSGSVLDGLEPGSVLSGALDDAWQAGLAGLSDDEVAGVTLAGGRQESQGAALRLAGTAELARRREASGDWQVIEHVDSEVAALLTLSRRSAANLVEFATSLARLPATMAALYAGRIDRERADVIAYETALLDDALATAVEQLVIEDAPSLTKGKLRERVRRAVLAADPDAARRRAEAAAKDARVELINERAGTAGLAGRDLPVAATLAADQRIDAWARQLKACGVKARLTQLRAAVFLSLLTGHDPLTFLPPADAEQKPPAAQDGGPGDGTGSGPEAPGPEAPGPEAPGPVGLRGSVHLTLTLAAWLGITKSPGDIAGFGPATAETCRQLADLIAQDPSSRWCLTLTDAAGHAVGHGCAHRPPPSDKDTGPPGRPNPPPGGTDKTPGGVNGPTRPSGAPNGSTGEPKAPPGKPDGPTDERDGPPGEPEEPPDGPEGPPSGIPGPPDGTPRPPGRSPGPAGGMAVRADAILRWLGRMKVGPVEAGNCSHAREVPGYRMPESLHHIVKTRQRTCSAPWCNRPAMRCDDDHTLPYDQGGRSCECNVAPLCRKCHQAKQAQGWRLIQPSPGVLVWELPHGRRYPVTPGIYPV